MHSVLSFTRLEIPEVDGVDAHLFRIIRDTDMEIQEDLASDLLESVDRSLKEQRSAPP